MRNENEALHDGGEAYPPEVLHTVARKRALAAISWEPSERVSDRSPDRELRVQNDLRSVRASLAIMCIGVTLRCRVRRGSRIAQQPPCHE